jgi:hypothetical protein
MGGSIPLLSLVINWLMRALLVLTIRSMQKAMIAETGLLPAHKDRVNSKQYEE